MKQLFQGSKAEQDALDAYLKLLRSGETISVTTHRHLLEYQLSSSQFAVLEALHHLGPLCQREIARKLQKSHGNITTVINNLEKRKLLERKRDSEDKRFFSVALTDSGRELVERIFPAHVTGIVRAMSSLTPAEQCELARLCKKLGQTISQ